MFILFYIGLKYFIGLACFGKFMQVLSILIQFKYFNGRTLEDHERPL